MERDELLELIERAAREGWRELDLRYQGLTELPSEISQLTQLQSLNLRWAGVVLACEGNQALVRADLSSNRITLAIRGPGAGRRDLLTRIREHLGAIHASIADLRPAAKLPVPGHPEIPPVDYAWLRKLERAGRAEFTPPGCIDPISVSQLLNGVEPPAARRSDTPKYQVNFNNYGSERSSQMTNHINIGDRGDTFSGDFRGANVNVKSKLEDVTQTIGALPTADAAAQAELKKLIEELSAALQQAPEDKAEAAEAVAQTAEVLIEQAAEEEPNKTMVKITGESLKQAAQNLTDVMPAVLNIATQIVAKVMDLVP